MALISDLITSAMGGYPEKPTVPTLPTVTAGGAQTSALAANLAALPQLESLASKTDLFNQGEIQKMLESFIPGYTDITKTISGTIASEARGELPKGVAEQITRSDAAKALMGGYGGTQMEGALTARDLGLTSLDLTGKALGEAAGWIGLMDRIAAPGQLNVQSMFITPGQELAQENLTTSEQWNVNWLKNQLAAMPDPATAAIARDVGDLTGGLAPSFMGGTPGGFSDMAMSRGGAMAQSGQLGSMFGGGGGAGGLDTTMIDTGGALSGADFAGSTGAAAGGGL